MSINAARHSPRPQVLLEGLSRGAIETAGIGARLREGREQKELSLRELARRVSVSPSLISQIERGRAMPSVGTLFAIANELGLVIDELFKDTERPVPGKSPPPAAASAAGPVQRRSGRRTIQLRSGVRWERLTTSNDPEVEFLYVVYDVGAASCDEGSLFRHGGKEYGYILSGRLGIQIGFESYELGPGDSLSFDAEAPHRLWTIGKEPVTAIFAIVRRHLDDRTPGPN